MCKHAHAYAVLYTPLHSYSYQILYEIATAIPSEIWTIAAPLLGPPIDSTAYSLRTWLQGESFFGSENKAVSILSYIPPEDLWRWVDQDVEKRAWYIANFAPKDLAAGPGKRSIVREILIRYGDREDVRRNLESGYFSGGWMGQESTHYQGVKQQLSVLLESETAPRVRDWLNQCVGDLERWVDRVRVKEEREDF